MVTSNCTASAPCEGMQSGWSVASGFTLVERSAAGSAEWDQTVRRVMGPTRRRRIHPSVRRVGRAGVCRRRGGGGDVLHHGSHGTSGAPGHGTAAAAADGQAGNGPGRRHRRDTQRRRAGGRAGAGGRRSQSGQAGRPDHRRHDRQRTLADGRRRAVGAGVDQQGPDGGRGAADAGPSGPDQHPGGGGQPERAGARRAGGCRGSDAVGGAARRRTPGTGVRRGSATWSSRCAAAA